MSQEQMREIARKAAEDIQAAHEQLPAASIFGVALSLLNEVATKAVAAEREDNRGLRAALMAIVEAPGGGPGKRIATQALADRQEPAPDAGAG